MKNKKTPEWISAKLQGMKYAATIGKISNG